MSYNPKVSNSSLANMAANTIKGNNTGSPASAADLTAAQVTAMLNLFTSSLQGLTPSSGGGTANFLRADGTWAAPSSGTVTSVSVVSANGFSGTVANATSTPAITMSTTVTGILFGNGTSVAAAIAGQFPILNQNTTGSSSSFTGSLVGDITGNQGATVLSATTNSTLTTLSALSLPYSQITGAPAAITALTGDGTAAGPGSVAFTLSTVNSNVGSFGSSTSVPSFTVNAKGLITAASGNVVIAPAGTLTGTTLASNVVSSSLTSVGTISSGTWNGAAVGPTFGGTGQSTYTTGDTLYASASNVLSKLSIGTTGQVLTVVAGIPSWSTPTASNGFTYVSSSTSVYGGTNSTPSITGINSTVVGVNAGTNLTDGNRTTLYGHDAGFSLLHGTKNTFIGAESAFNYVPTNTVLGNNTAVGYSSLGGLTTGFDNTAIGSSSGIALTSGDHITLLGFQADVTSGTETNSTALGAGSIITASNQMMFGNSSITSNVMWNSVTLNGSSSGAITIATQSAAGTYNFNLPTTAGTAGQVLTSQGGVGSAMTWTTPVSNGFVYLSSNTSVYGGTNSTLSFTGANNLVSGVSAGNALTTGHDNTIIGWQSGVNTATANFLTLIGVSAGGGVITGNNSVMVGYQAGSNVTSAADNVLIGYQAGKVANATNLTAVGSGSGGANSTPMSGSNNSLFGYFSGNELTTGHDNVIIGANAGNQATTANFTTLIGSLAGGNGLAVMTGADNTFVGYTAGGRTTSASSNTYIGSNAAALATSAANSTVVGAYAVQSGVMTGSNNTIMGYTAGASITSAASLTAVGAGAAGTGIMTGANNSLFGYQSGAAITSGHDNTFLGYQAGNAATTTAFAVAVGASSVASSTANVAIGYLANASAAVGVIAVGSSATASGATSIAIGYGSADNGATNTVALGQVQPNNSAHTGCFVVGQNSANSGSPIGNTTASNQIAFGTSGASAVTLKDMFIGRGAIGDATATNVTFQPSPMVGSNLAGASMTILGGKSTGNAAGGIIIFQTSVAGISGSAANAQTTAVTIDSSGFLNIGVAGSRLGVITLSGNTSGTISIVPQPVAGTYNFNLPTTSGTTGQVLTSQGGGSTAMTWATPVSVTFTAPTIQKFTSGSGTYTTPTSPPPLYIRVRMVGAGGGGSGSGTGTQTDGGNGGNTTFGTSLLTANGGKGGAANSGTVSQGGAGGTATLGTAIGTALTGGTGQGSGNGLNPYSSTPVGGSGAGSALGGSGGGGDSILGPVNAGPGAAGATNTGAGGGGAGGGSATSVTGGTGGGAGGYIDALITSSISATYSYAIGAAGTSGGAGTSGASGGAGGSGYIEVTEYYQ